MALTREEQLDAIERYYRSQVASAPSDEEELAIAEALLEAAERGHVVNDAGTGTLIVRSPELPVDADFLLDEGALRRQQLRRALPMTGLLLVAAVALVLLYGGASATPEEVAISTSATVPATLSTVTLTPTVTHTPSPTATAMPTPTSTPTPLAPEEVEVEVAPVKLDPDAILPVSLEVAGHYFAVVPTGLRDDAWAYAPEPDRVSWLAGSYVNVILGLPYTTANAHLLTAGLALSDTVALRTSVGAVNHYTVEARRSVGMYEIEAFRQHRAGLTLVLLGGQGESPGTRLIVHAVPAGADGEEVIAAQRP